MSDFWNHKVRGCQPRGTVRQQYQPRGTASLTTRTVRIGDAEITGIKPRIVCTVNTNRAKDKETFLSLCREQGVDAFRVGKPGWTTEFECVGTEDSLLAIVFTTMVLNWHYVVSTGNKKGVVDKDRERVRAGRARPAK